MRDSIRSNIRRGSTCYECNGVIILSRRRQ
uniref:Uncharacterized protein n=1 Tax=Arundo donax TaxID=35708 RepID=A0A0A8Y455_ARUDO